MKARIKETGGVFNVEWFYLENGCNYDIDDIELIFEGSFSKLPIDWEQRRFELVKAAIQGIVSSDGRRYMLKEEEMKHIARWAIQFSDAVLAEYRKGGNE